MKKKAIEKIPYMTAKKAPTRYDYVAVVQRKVIAREQHLFIEIYINEQQLLKIPIYRYVYTKKDWCKFNTELGTWHRTRMRESDSCMLGWFNNSDETTYIASEDILKIRKFTRKTIYRESDWWEYIEKLENEINWQKQKKRNDKKQRELKERCESVPGIPDDFKTWYKTVLFKDVNYLYYKRKGRYATFFCSHCGKTYTCATEKKKEGYEGQFERVVEIPVNRTISKCEKCGAVGTFKTLGNTKHVYEMGKYCYMGQQAGKRFIFRYFSVKKIFSKTEKERYSIIEIAREFFEEGKNPIKDYHLYNTWTGTAGWYNHNIGGIGKQISMDAAKIYPGTFGELKGTFLQYSGIENYTEQHGKVALARYMELYTKMPFVEMLSKAGLHKLIDNMIMNGNYLELNVEAEKPEDILGIKKEKMKLLIRKHGETDLLRVVQKEKELNQNWTEEECMNLLTVWPDWHTLETALRHMTIKKFLNRIEKYAGCRFTVSCTAALDMLHHVSTTYLDYLQMREALGYDLDNSIIQYPKDLEDAHRKMILERDKEEIKKRGKEVDERFDKIKKNYRKLRKKYAFENGSYSIRPARTASEIVEEGRVLHHCVGGDNYLRKHNDEVSAILFLRLKDKPEQQYVTVEVKGYKILQWYGAYDKKPDKEKIEDWLNNWVKIIRARIITTKDSEQIAI